MIWTECMPDVDGSAIDGAIVLVEDDPSLLEAGMALSRMHRCIDCVSVVLKGSLLSKTRELSSAGRNVLAIAWRSEFTEGRTPGRSIVASFPHYEGSHVFGRPSLCVLSANGRTWGSVPDRPKVRIDEGYPKICERYLEAMGNGSVKVDGPGADLLLRMIRTVDTLEEGYDPIDTVLMDEPVLVEI